jgi:hypothetical protein
MRILRILGWSFIGFGILWLLIAGGVYFLIPSVAPASGATSFVSMVLLFVFGAIGVLFTVAGGVVLVIGTIGARRAKAKISQIDMQGTPAKGKVTFVDRNYTVRYGGRAIYSIVEFTFRDSSGMEHAGRKDNVDSDLVIRDQIAVGSEVDLKYLPENPDENILMMHDPRDGTVANAL